MMKQTGRLCNWRWYRKLLSIVINTSKTPVIWRKSSPFFMPDQPASGTVFTSCSVSAFLSLRGRHSSIRIFIRGDGPGALQDVDHLRARDRWKVVQERVYRFARCQIIDEMLDRDAGAAKDRRAAQDFRVPDDHRLTHPRLLSFRPLYHPSRSSCGTTGSAGSELATPFAALR